MKEEGERGEEEEEDGEAATARRALRRGAGEVMKRAEESERWKEKEKGAQTAGGGVRSTQHTPG